MTVVTLIAGCSGEPHDTSKPSGSDDTSTTPTVDSGSSETGDTDTQTEPSGGVFHGTLTDPSGVPVQGATLRFCRGTLCRTGTTDGSGGFEFGSVPAEWHSFDALAPEDLGKMATLFVPLLFGESEDREVDLTLLPYDDESPLDKGKHERAAGTGLYITASTGDLTPPLLLPDATEIAGVRIPEELWVPTDGIEGTVLAQWFVDPFDYTATTPLPVRIDDEWSLADGTELEVYVGNYEQSAWLDAGTATAYAGSITGAALSNLATVLLVQP